MSTSALPTARPDEARTTARVAGLLYLVTFISSIPAVFLLDPVLHDPTYIASGGFDPRIVAGCLLDLVNALACIGTAVALFSIVRREHEGLALGFVASRIYEAAVIMIGVVCLLAIVTLRKAGNAGTDRETMIAVGRSLVAVRDWTFLLGPSLAPAFNAALLGTLLYRSRLVPRLIPIVGLIGAPLLLSATLGTMFGINQQVSAWSGLATLPIFLWELALGLWLTFRGFEPSAPILASAPRS
jgi:hypothetical protein